MADSLKNYQSQPAAGVMAALVTAGASAQIVLSTLRICNLSSGPTTVTVRLAEAAAVDVDSQSVLRNIPLAAYESLGITEGWTLEATDVIRVGSANGQVVFTAFGTERT